MLCPHCIPAHNVLRWVRWNRVNSQTSLGPWDYAVFWNQALSLAPGQIVDLQCGPCFTTHSGLRREHRSRPTSTRPCRSWACLRRFQGQGSGLRYP